MPVLRFGVRVCACVCVCVFIVLCVHINAGPVRFAAVVTTTANGCVSFAYKRRILCTMFAVPFIRVPPALHRSWSDSCAGVRQQTLRNGTVKYWENISGDGRGSLSIVCARPTVCEQSRIGFRMYKWFVAGVSYRYCCRLPSILQINPDNATHRTSKHWNTGIFRSSFAVPFAKTLSYTAHAELPNWLAHRIQYTMLNVRNTVVGWMDTLVSCVSTHLVYTTLPCRAVLCCAVCAGVRPPVSCFSPLFMQSL